MFAPHLPHIIIIIHKRINDASGPTMNTFQMNTRSEDSDMGDGSDQMFKSSAVTLPESAQHQIENPLMLEPIILAQAGFAALQTGTGEILGVSKLLPVGQVVGVYIDLSRIPDRNESFSVILYADNGNRMFDAHTDIPLGSL